MTSLTGATMSMLERPDGRIAYTDEGTGPLVVLVPGMGDTQATWRDVVEGLRGSYRVVTTDLRGHGDSDTSFTRHGDDATGEDVLALVEHLDAGPAVLMGNSMGASAAVWAAAQRPDLVAGLVLVSPLLSTGGRAMEVAVKMTFRVLFSGPWGPALWGRYYTSPLSRGRRSPRLAEHVEQVVAALRRPGRMRAFRALVNQLDHGVADAVADQVTTPAVVVVGDRDPDYRDPAATLATMAERLHASAVLVPDVAHYAQHQAPEVVLDATEQLIASLTRDGERWAVRGA
ncbi:alpha/beta hydrolase [Actinotalea sp. M2MS4P-6]|uniref:alpha/beta fold hydrolase n=1 Tax=Actinotalea sp. M2MS4P-6 TaxID=2983762 RepID=UPI0021E4EC45|nr:alpha/beta hydrolase [Actinotalea sp. M2MS4P-6]MCV2396376.1 alpha/beta hydrolase [Actinotalea sp. M2MS4P-6]